ncbi:MAG: NTP transferase domain-containing protein [Candidatus Eisenbacteria bacterium]
MMKNLSAVLLAGRENRHLKTAKWTLPFGESTVLNRTLDAYLDAGAAEVVVVLASRSDEVRASLGTILSSARGSKVRLVEASDPEGNSGLLLREGVAAIAGNGRSFALGSGEQPLLTAELLTTLAEAFAAGKKKILAPVCQGAIGQPVFFDASLAKDFARLKNDGDAWEILKAHSDEVNDLHRYETSLIRSIDDLEDYYAMLDIAKLPHPELAQIEGTPQTSTPEMATAPVDAGGETYHSDLADEQ